MEYESPTFNKKLKLIKVHEVLQGTLQSPHSSHPTYIFINNDLIRLSIHKNLKFRDHIENLCRQAYTAQKMKFAIKDFFSKCDQIRRPVDLVTFTEEILNRNLHFFMQCKFQATCSTQKYKIFINKKFEYYAMFY